MHIVSIAYQILRTAACAASQRDAGGGGTGEGAPGRTPGPGQATCWLSEPASGAAAALRPSACGSKSSTWISSMTLRS